MNKRKYWKKKGEGKAIQKTRGTKHNHSAFHTPQLQSRPLSPRERDGIMRCFKRQPTYDTRQGSLLKK